MTLLDVAGARVDVAIAGGGIIGLSAALELAAAGLRVAVYERGQAMHESSWAAAGMLAADDPENPALLKLLSRLSIRLYPEFLARVEALSGEKIPIRTTRTLQGSSHLPDGYDPLSVTELAKLAPGLHSGPYNFFSLDEQSFDPRDLVLALPKAVRAAGVTLYEQTTVTAIHSGHGQVELETSAGPIIAKHFINAAGAWAAQLTSSLPVEPRKGQMLSVELSGPTQLACVLRTPELYIVPRGLGRYIIGATVEDAAFDKSVQPEAIHQLLADASALWPPLKQAQIVEAWAGLRPGTADHLPMIGSDGPNCWLATGHFRNGILLAPATARIMRELITGSETSIDLAPFRCDRFAAASVHSS